MHTMYLYNVPFYNAKWLYENYYLKEFLKHRIKFPDFGRVFFAVRENNLLYPAMSFFFNDLPKY